MRIITAKPLKAFRVQLAFDNGETGVVDLSHFAGRGVFKAWNVPDVFDSVKVTGDGAIEWPGEIDLCPDSLYFQLTGKLPEDLHRSADAEVQVRSHA